MTKSRLNRGAKGHTINPPLGNPPLGNQHLRRSAIHPSFRPASGSAYYTSLPNDCCYRNRQTQFLTAKLSLLLYQGDCALETMAGPSRADFVAKLESCRATNFSQKDRTGSNRRFV